MRVVGPADARIPVAIETVGDGDRCEFPDLGLRFDILHVPGHTLSHIAFLGHGALFCGDTLFSAGCGRMFEGTPQQMWASLSRLRDLPPETLMYCGHEYTAANLRFALTVEPANAAALEYRDRVARLRAADQPSLPSPLSLERRVNPFLRCDVPAVRAGRCGACRPAAPRDADVFAYVARLEGPVPLMIRARHATPFAPPACCCSSARARTQAPQSASWRPPVVAPTAAAE